MVFTRLARTSIAVLIAFAGLVFPVTASHATDMTVFAEHAGGFGMAISPNGDVAAADYMLGKVTVFHPNGENSVLTGFTHPHDVAYNSHGDLFVAQFGRDRGVSAVARMNAGSSDVQYAWATGFVGIGGIAIDSGDQVWVADSDANVIYAISADGTPTRISGSWPSVHGFSFDSTGRLFIPEMSEGKVVIREPNGDVSTLITGLDHPVAVDSDGAGGVYVAEEWTGIVWHVSADGERDQVYDSSSPIGGVLILGKAVLIGEILGSDWELNRIIRVPLTEDPACEQIQPGTCTLTFHHTSSVIRWAVPQGVRKLNIKLVGGTGGDDLRGTSSNLAHTLSFDLQILNSASGSDRLLKIGIGEGGESGRHACPANYWLSPAKNPLGKFYGGPGRAWCYPSAGASGGAGTALIAQGVTYVAAGTGGGSTGSGASWWDFATSARDWTIGESRSDGSNGYGFVQGGGGGLVGGVGGGWSAGSSGSSGSSPETSGLEIGSESSTPGKSGYVVLSYPVIEAPDGLTTSIASRALHINWDAVSSLVEGSNLSYTATTDSGESCTTTGTSCAITGLTNGRSYSVTVSANDGTYTSLPSVAVTGMPVGPATAPSITSVLAVNAKATLGISAPSNIGDASLTGYDYSINNGSTWSHFASVTGPFTITGLTNATAYQVKVRAVNSAGAGDASVAVPVNPTKLIPAKPVIASVVGGNASATLNITTPTDATAQSVTGYQYSINKGATYQNAVVSNGSFTITGLTNGVSALVQIRAVNFNGTSTASLAKSVIPSTTPAAPSITTVTPSAGALSIAFTAPNTGGSAITCYQYSLDGGSTWVAPKTVVKSSPLKVTGLSNATTYPIKIRAVNAKGIGASSSAVNATTPVLVPSAPRVTSIAKSSTTLTIDVSAPTSNGGALITNYAYSINNGTTWTLVNPASTSTRILIIGLKPNTIYPVLIAAVNSAGRGASSAKNLAITLR